MGSQQFCLKWNNHQTNLLNVFEQLLQNEAFVDVTLACEGLSLKAHKMVLSACSPYFQGLFLENPCKHPIVILNSIKYSDLKAIIDFMYKGEVNVSQEQLSALLKTAELLKVKGLAEVTNQTTQSLNTQTTETISSLGPNSPSSIPSTQNSTQPRNTSSPPPKRKKLRSSVASSAANSPQTPGSVTNNSILNQPKNMPSDPSTVALDIKSEPHVVPVVAELSQEEHSTNHDRHLDQNTDQPPDLTLERSPEIVDDHSSLSNVTADMAYDHSSADYSGQDHSGPPDITPSVQAVPSTSGMQSSTQDKSNDVSLNLINFTGEFDITVTNDENDYEKIYGNSTVDDRPVLKAIQCPRCQQPFPDLGSLLSHSEDHGTSSLTCLFCDRSFGTRKLLLRHIHSHVIYTPSTPETLTCPDCCKEFKFLSVYARHVTQPLGFFSHFSCRLCGEVYKRKGCLRHHMITYHKATL